MYTMSFMHSVVLMPPVMHNHKKYYNKSVFTFVVVTSKERLGQREYYSN